MGPFANCVTSYFVEKTSTFIIPIYNQQSYALRNKFLSYALSIIPFLVSKRQTELVSARLIFCKDA